MRIAIILCLALASFNAWASDANLPSIGQISPQMMFLPSASDLSLDFLRNTFGSVGNALAGADSQLLGQLFSVFNYAILLFAGCWISYIVVTNTINASQSGGPAGKKINTWMHVRAILGLAMIMPHYAGYSWIQVMTMSVIIQGVGFADTIWTNVLDQMELTQGQIYNTTSYTAIATPTDTMKDWLSADTINGTNFTNSTASTGTAHIDDLYASALCTAAIKKQADIATQESIAFANESGIEFDSSTNPSFGYFLGKDCSASSSDRTLCFGSTDQPSLCGKYKINVTVNGSSVSDFESSANQLLQGFFENMAAPLLDLAEKVVDDAYDMVIDDNSDTNYDFDCGSGCTGSSTFFSVAQSAELMLSSLPSSPSGDVAADASGNANWIDDAKSAGWINAGSYYLNILGVGTIPTTTDIEYTMKFTTKKRTDLSQTVDTSNAAYINGNLYSVYLTALGAIQGYTKSTLDTIDEQASTLTNTDASSFAATSNDYLLDSTDTSTSTLSTSTYQRMNLTLSEIVKHILDVVWTYPSGSASSTGIFTGQSYTASSDFAQVSLTVAQDNLYAMLAKVIATVIGLDVVDDDGLFNYGGTDSGWSWDQVMGDRPCSSDDVKTYCTLSDTVTPVADENALCPTNNWFDCSSAKSCYGNPQYIGMGNTDEGGIDDLYVLYPGDNDESKYLCGCEATRNIYLCYSLYQDLFPGQCNYANSEKQLTQRYADQCDDNFPSSTWSCYGSTPYQTDLIGMQYDYDSYEHSKTKKLPDDSIAKYSYLGCSYFTPARGLRSEGYACTPETVTLAPCTGSTPTCYDMAVQKGCIVNGYGLIGSLYSLSQGNAVDPITYLATLGMTLMDTSLAFMDATLQGIVNSGLALVIKYTGEMTAWTLVFTAIGYAGKAIKENSGGTGGNVTNAITSTMGKAGGVIGNIFNILFSFDMTSLLLFVPFATVMSSTLFTLGAILGIYVPFIPFFIFSLAVIGWLLLVIESMVAAPLVAVSLTHPAGHDLLGRAEQAVILLFGVFIRPAAITIGFTMALTLSYIAMQLVNYSFIMLLVNFLSYTIDSDADTMITLIGTVGVLLVYTYTMIDIINHAFSLIYLVPQKLLRWIGGSPESGGMIRSMLGSVQSKFSQSASSVGSSMGRSVSSAQPLSAKSIGPSVDEISSDGRSKSMENAGEKRDKEKADKEIKEEMEQEKKERRDPDSKTSTNTQATRMYKPPEEREYEISTRALDQWATFGLNTYIGREVGTETSGQTAELDADNMAATMFDMAEEEYEDAQVAKAAEDAASTTSSGASKTPPDPTTAAGAAASTGMMKSADERRYDRAEGMLKEQLNTTSDALDSSSARGHIDAAIDAVHDAGLKPTFENVAITCNVQALERAETLRSMGDHRGATQALNENNNTIGVLKSLHAGDPSGRWMVASSMDADNTPDGTITHAVAMAEMDATMHTSQPNAGTGFVARSDDQQLDQMHGAGGETEMAAQTFNANGAPPVATTATDLAAANQMEQAGAAADITHGSTPGPAVPPTYQAAPPSLATPDASVEATTQLTKGLDILAQQFVTAMQDNPQSGHTTRELLHHFVKREQQHLQRSMTAMEIQEVCTHIDNKYGGISGSANHIAMKDTADLTQHIDRTIDRALNIADHANDPAFMGNDAQHTAIDAIVQAERSGPGRQMPLHEVLTTYIQQTEQATGSAMSLADKNSAAHYIEATHGMMTGTAYLREGQTYSHHATGMTPDQAIAQTVMVPVPDTSGYAGTSGADAMAFTQYDSKVTDQEAEAAQMLPLTMDGTATDANLNQQLAPTVTTQPTPTVLPNATYPADMQQGPAMDIGTTGAKAMAFTQYDSKVTDQEAEKNQGKPLPNED